MASPDITLYTTPGSCAIVPHILLNYAALSFKPKPVARKRLTSDFASTNPKKQVPVLVVDGEVITENPAIAHMINHLAPEANIMGQDPMQLVRVCEWLNYFSGSMHAQAFGPYVRPCRFTNDPTAEAGIKAASFEKLKERFALIESKLPEQGWLVGESFTAADAYLVPFYQWTTARLGIDVDAEYPKWAMLVHRMYELEAVRKSLEEEKKIDEDLGHEKFS